MTESADNGAATVTASEDADGGSLVDAAAEPPRRRYERVESAGRAHLRCRDAPNLRLRVERGLTVTEDARSRYPKQSIFLDGAYGEGPLFDNEARHYSLDHHQGCHRSITLATCEQAAVLLHSGLPLDEDDWWIHVNEPDLDALLAAWLLFNHRELLHDAGGLLWQVMPLVRVEGMIDAHGLDAGPISGLTEQEYDRHKKRIDALLARERRLKASGEWSTVDVVAYALEMLDELDRTLYPEGYVDRLLDIEELARVPLDRRSSAFLCRATGGIYAVESHLKQRHDKQVGVIVLDQGGGRYTLRQVDSFLERNLQDVYPILNARDDRVGADSGKEPCGSNRWGGSSNIGGSPRQTGTGLGGEEILRAVRDGFRGGGWLRRVVRRFKG